jgi:hypothetical protein
MSEHVYWIEHKAAKILYADYSGLSGQEYIRTIEEFKNELAKQSPGSVVTLSNVTDSHVSAEVKDKFKEMADQTRGISKAAATVGLTGFKKAIAVLIRNDMFWANSLEEAQDWLAEQVKA